MVRADEGPVRRVSPLSMLFFAAAVAFVVIGVVYFTRTSVQLPTFLPGHYERSHAAGHIAQARKHHFKLGVVAFGLAALSVIWAGWFADEPDS